MDNNKILDVRDLKTYFHTREGTVKSVDGVSFDVNKGEILGIVGESGAGKSVTGFSLLKLIEEPGEIVGGEILFKDKNLLNLKEKEMEKIRGNEISMVFQDPMTSLNPVLTIGLQLIEVLTFHLDISKKEAKKKAIELLELVGIPSPEERLNHYPNQLSGGMRQRVVIAIAMASDPELLIADEPTTALDVTIQAQIMGLMKNLIEEKQTSMVIISHDLALISEIADKIAVMYAGKIIEYGPKPKVIGNPEHPYTEGLIDSIPLLSRKQKRLDPIKGLMPSPLNLPDGCKFKPRCNYADSCCDTMPDLNAVEESHLVACHNIEKINGKKLKGVG